MLRKVLLAATCLMPAAAHAGWQESSSKHFLVHALDASGPPAAIGILEKAAEKPKATADKPGGTRS